jgi:tetratricopeptide (TPR) repeat protein
MVISCLVLAVITLLSGCASAPTAGSTRAAEPFQDHAFQPPSVAVVSPEGLFALNPAMRRYLQQEISTEVRLNGPQQGLLNGLYRKQKLLLEYDATQTRTAAEAFEARAGNCLSLVIMTAAFAKALDLPVRYQSVTIDDHWTRNGDMLLLAGHINLSLGGPRTVGTNVPLGPDMLTIDFIPPEDLPTKHSRVIDEGQVVAMYYNNRAAELVYAGRLDEAYWMARAAIGHYPRYHAAYITLGSIYRRHGDLAGAERVLRHVLQLEPDNLLALGNLAITLQAGGRTAEADTLNARLAKLEPNPPYAFFDRGILALQAGDYRKARDLFQQEVNRDVYVPEFHFWLAVTCYQLGDVATARRHMQDAMNFSTTPADRGLYAAKLAYLRAPQATTSH